MENQKSNENGRTGENDEAPPMQPADKKREQKECADPGNIGNNKKLRKDYEKTVLCTSSEHLFDQAQSLITEINDKRKNDSVLLSEFKKAMELQLDNCSTALERALFHNYGMTGNIMQEKLQDLYATLDRITKLEQELVQFKEALGMLYNDVSSN